MDSNTMHTEHKAYISIKWCNNNHDQLYVMLQKRSIKKQYHKPILKPHICFHFISFESLCSVLLSLLMFCIRIFFYSIYFPYHVIMRNRWSWTKAIIVIPERAHSSILIASLIEYKIQNMKNWKWCNFEEFFKTTYSIHIVADIIFILNFEILKVHLFGIFRHSTTTCSTVSICRNQQMHEIVYDCLWYFAIYW